MSDNTNNRKAALSRANLYSFLTEAFIRLPDEEFIERITSGPMQAFLDQAKRLDHKKVLLGVETIQSFLAGIDPKDRAAVIEEMAVDRTRLIRSAGKGKLKAPYEGLYKKKEDAHAIILSVSKFYKRLGITPVSYANDSPDFFCTEMDFMKQLCLLEADGRSNPAEIGAIEKEFLKQHLGSWIGSYCEAAEKHAKTGFYKGLLLFLDGFIELESNRSN